jgi:hypothetical protein
MSVRCQHLSNQPVAIITVQQGGTRGLGLLNAAYITLIPKKKDVLAAKDFRPISLVHSFGKLLSKILANPLALSWTR